MAAGLDAAQGVRLRTDAGPARLRGGPAPHLRLLLAAPLGEGACSCSRRRSLAFGLVYLASLGALFISSFWTVNPFTTEIEHIWNLDNYRTI